MSAWNEQKKGGSQIKVACPLRVGNHERERERGVERMIERKREREKRDQG